MEIYIKHNHKIKLFLLHLLFPMIEFMLKMMVPSKDLSLTLAYAVGIGHVAILSSIYRQAMKSESFNYLLSLGESRAAVFKEIVIMYAKEILVYSILAGLLLLIAGSKNVAFYMMVRILFSMITVPMFIYNMLHVNPTSYTGLVIFTLIAKHSILLLIIIAIPVSAYLMKVSKDKMLGGNLV